MRTTLGTAAATALLGAAPLWPGAREEPPVTALEFLGEATIPPGTRFAGEPVGGLSGLVWDAARGVFLALSDDGAERAPARYYALRVDLADGRLDATDLAVVGRTHLRDAAGRPHRPGTIDPEGFARSPAGRLYFSSEGVPVLGAAPFVAELRANGRERRRFPLPARYSPAHEGGGVRSNLGLESLTVTPDGRLLIAGLENALVADGPAADVDTASPARIVIWPLDRREAPRELVYRVEPVSRAPAAGGGFRVNGLVDLVALSATRLLALEREWVAGVGGRVCLYALELDGATVAKRLLADLGDLGLPLDNFEAMAFGPALADGRRTFWLLADDNFDAATQSTKLWAFAAESRRLEISELQGAAHRSPREGSWVAEVEGVVTALERRGSRPGFFLESARPDGDRATAEGLRVEWAGALPVVGETVRVGGRVVERSAGERQLTVTTLVATAVESAVSAAPLPPPQRWGSERGVPPELDGDGLTAFRPERDALDFWESLEGMRVELPESTVSGPTSGYGELVVLPDGAPRTASSAAGGVLLTPAGAPLDLVPIAVRAAGAPPQLAVGARLAGPLLGIVDYSFSSYKLLVHAPLGVLAPGVPCAAAAALRAGPGELRIASFNVENLSAADEGERFTGLGELIARRLAGPEIVALQEVQDDSGRTAGDGVVTARATLERLVAAVRSAGGPAYAWVAVEPELDREGGVPGGNIRVALLFDSSRVGFEPRGAAGPLDATEPDPAAGDLRLTLNPGRVAPRSAAFTLAEGEGVRRSLAARFEVFGRPLVVIVNHWSSKFDDDRAFGAVQPPRRPTGGKRLAQARAIREFAERLVATDPEAAVVVLGDLNDLPWSDPVAALAAPPFVGLLGLLPDGERYTYNFVGVAQAIDHVVVSPALATGAAVEIVHANSDCPDAVRTSDHDPVVARLRLGPAARP